MNDREIFALVLMPFDSRFDDVYRIGIQEAAARNGIVAERLDKMIFVEGMMEKLYQQIEAADIVIADMSDRNPNVFYEVGFADATGKLCILLTRKADDIPFDLKHRRHIVYGESIGKLRDQLERELLWAKQEVLDRDPIRIDIRVDVGACTSTMFSVDGALQLRVDLYNESKRHKFDLHAMYLYVDSDDWKISQANSECPSAVSEIPHFRHKFLLTLPAFRLHLSGWAQVRIDGSKVLSRYVPTPYYECNDQALVRLVTDGKMFDRKVSLQGVFQDSAAAGPPGGKPEIRASPVLDGHAAEGTSYARVEQGAPVDRTGLSLREGDQIAHPLHGIARVRRVDPDGTLYAVSDDGWRFVVVAREVKKLA